MTMPPPSRLGEASAVVAFVLLSESKTKFNLPAPEPERVMDWLMTMELAARSLSVTSVAP